MNYKFEPLNMREHRRCPKCGKLMIKRIDFTIYRDSDARQEWNWWCNCGNKETGGILKGMPETTWVKQEWERVNNIRR